MRPLPRLEMVGALGRGGFLAALMLPKGVEEKVMLVVVAPEAETERTGGRLGERCGGEALEVGLVDVGGEDGEGGSKAVSESISASGVEVVDAIAM
jgi:hypothetical protein